jgi:gamma-tubulin complex component 3
MGVSELIQDLITELCGELSDEEMKWAKRWVSNGPLQITGSSINRDAVVLSLLKEKSHSIDLMNLVSRVLDDGVLGLLNNLKNNRNFQINSPKISPIHPPIFEIPQIGSPRVPVLSIRGPAAESDLIQDLVYIIQGIDGKWIKFNNRGSDITVADSVILEEHVMSGIRFISQIGIYYKLISNNLNNFPILSNPVKYVLNEFLSISATIDSDVSKWTILRLIAFLSIPIKKIEHLHGFITDVTLADNDQVFDTLFAYRNGKFFVSMYSRLFDGIMKILNSNINNWMIYGQLQSTFFIVSPPLVVTHPREYSLDSPDPWRMWNEQFQLIENKIPKFIQNPRKIFIIGKSVNYLKTFCGIRVDPPCDEEEKGYEEVVEFVGYQVEEIINNKIKKELIGNLINLHLLINRNDFIQILIKLNQNNINISKYYLNSLIDTAIRSSSIGPDPDLLPRIDTEPAVEGVMTIRYSPDLHLGNILTLDCLRIFSEIFSLVFRINLYKFLILENFRKLKINNLIVLNLINFKFLRFIEILESHFSHSVIAAEYSRIMSQLNERDNFSIDELIEIISNYFNNLNCELFLNFHNSEISLEILNLFNLIKRFLFISETVQNEVQFNLSEYRMNNINGLLTEIDETFNLQIERIITKLGEKSSKKFHLIENLNSLIV